MKKIMILIVIILISGCARKETTKISYIQHVDVQSVQKQNIPYQFSYPAMVVGLSDFPLTPQVSGIIFKQLYQEGAMVKKGQALYQIDPRAYLNNLQIAQGALTKDSNAMKQYQIILQRYQQLYPSGAVAKQDVDTAMINYNNAQGLVETDQGNAAQAKLNLDFTLVRSPVDGLIGERQVTIGDTVVAYQTVLNNINSANNLYLEFSMPEIDRLMIQTQLQAGRLIIPLRYHFSVDAELADDSLLKNVGYVDFTDTRISSQNGTWALRASINDSKLGEKLLSGQFVHIYLNGAIFKNTMALPQVAIFHDNQGAFVYVSNNKKVIRRGVDLGLMVGQLWLIESGLNVNDQVITDGGIKVQAGDTVIIDQVTTQLNLAQ